MKGQGHNPRPRILGPEDAAKAAFVADRITAEELEARIERIDNGCVCAGDPPAYHALGCPLA
jgi:hypothetical protein